MGSHRDSKFIITVTSLVKRSRGICGSMSSSGRSPWARWSSGMSRSPVLHSLSVNRLRTAIRRYSGLGSSVSTRSSGWSSPRSRSRRRSVIGLSTVMSPPVPLPGPKPSTSRDRVGTNCGTSTASTRAAPPSEAAEVRTTGDVTETVVPGLRPASPMPRPHRLVCSRCCRKSSSMNPLAVSAKLHHGTPPPSMLTGML